jgi:HicA toxin of bacterial toxin-antitoxin,
MAANYSREVKALLRKAGCRFDRQGAGDHEIWLCPKARRPITIDSNIKSRHTANAILKQAGLPKAF